MYFCYLTSSVLNICVNVVTEQRNEQVKKNKGEDTLICESIVLFLKSRVLILIQKTMNVQKEKKEKLRERSKMKYLAILVNTYSSLAIFDTSHCNTE